MSDEPAPAKDPEPTKPAPRAAADLNNPVTHCPACHGPAILKAHDHCPPKEGKKWCAWKRCSCGAIWDTLSGRYNLPIDGGKRAGA